MLTTLCGEPVEELGDKVADNDRGASPENTLGGFKGHGLEIENTCLSGGVNHGEFTANLVGSNGQVLSKLLGVTDNVQVLTSGLDHDDIGTLIDITNNGAASETTTSGRKLVALAVAERRA